MIHLLDLLLQVRYLLLRHAFHDAHGKGAGPEFVDQDVLSHHGIDVLWQIGQKVVVDLCMQVADRRRDGQDQGQDQNGDF